MTWTGTDPQLRTGHNQPAGDRLPPALELACAHVGASTQQSLALWTRDAAASGRASAPRSRAARRARRGLQRLQSRRLLDVIVAARGLSVLARTARCAPGARCARRPQPRPLPLTSRCPEDFDADNDVDDLVLRGGGSRCSTTQRCSRTRRRLARPPGAFKNGEIAVADPTRTRRGPAPRRRGRAALGARRWTTPRRRRSTPRRRTAAARGLRPRRARGPAAGRRGDPRAGPAG